MNNDESRRTFLGKVSLVAPGVVVGGVAGMFLDVGLLPGAYAAGAMSFIVELLTHGPVFAQPAHAAPAWLTRTLWAAKAVAAAALAGSVFCLWSRVLGVQSPTLRPMAFTLCVGLMWYFVAQLFGPQAGDMWTAGAQPALLAGAITAGGFAVAVGLDHVAGDGLHLAPHVQRQRASSTTIDDQNVSVDDVALGIRPGAETDVELAALLDMDDVVDHQDRFGSPLPVLFWSRLASTNRSRTVT